MKFSAILVSVNLAATLPVAVATAANAADEPKSETANFLKSSLASAKPAKNSALRGRKLSYSTPVHDTVGSVNGVKLRPFVANRKLPSQRDLDLQLISQTAKMASPPALVAQTPQVDAPSPVLSGGVSEAYASMPERQSAGGAGIATYGSVGYVKQTSSRVLPGQSPSVPGQIRQLRSTRRQRTAAPQQQQPLPKFEPPTEPAPIAQEAPPPNGNAFGAVASRAPMMPASMQMEPAPFSPDEQAIIDRMVQNTRNHSVDDTGAGNFSAAPQGGAGPAPFPLSLLPQDALKQLIAGGRSGVRRSVADAPPAYFGSWHGQTSLANLPAAGFHSNLQGREPHGSNFTQYASSPRPAAPLHKHRASSVVHASGSNSSLGQLRRLPVQEMKVAPYAAYPRASGSAAY